MRPDNIHKLILPGVDEGKGKSKSKGKAAAAVVALNKKKETAAVPSTAVPSTSSKKSKREPSDGDDMDVEVDGHKSESVSESESESEGGESDDSEDDDFKGIDDEGPLKEQLKKKRKTEEKEGSAENKNKDKNKKRKGPGEGEATKKEATKKKSPLPTTSSTPSRYMLLSEANEYVKQLNAATEQKDVKALLEVLDKIKDRKFKREAIVDFKLTGTEHSFGKYIKRLGKAFPGVEAVSEKCQEVMARISAQVAKEAAKEENKRLESEAREKSRLEQEVKSSQKQALLNMQEQQQQKSKKEQQQQQQQQQGREKETRITNPAASAQKPRNFSLSNFVKAETPTASSSSSSFSSSSSSSLSSDNKTAASTAEALGLVGNSSSSSSTAPGSAGIALKAPQSSSLKMLMEDPSESNVVKPDDPVRTNAALLLAQCLENKKRLGPPLPEDVDATRLSWMLEKRINTHSPLAVSLDRYGARVRAIAWGLCGRIYEGTFRGGGVRTSLLSGARTIKEVAHLDLRELDRESELNELV